MKKNKKAAVILYVLILLFMASTLVFIVLSDMEKWNNYLSVSDLTLMEKKVLSQNAKINLDHHYKNNSDWDWFRDQLKCPDFKITKKISDNEEKTEPDPITTTLTFENDNFYCSSWDYKLLLKKPSGWQYFFDFPETERWQNTIFSDFLIWEEKYSLNNWIVEDINIDISKVEVEKWFDAWIDGIDDNLNNDDFKEDSTISGFVDNDTDAKKEYLKYIDEIIEPNSRKRVNIFSIWRETVYFLYSHDCKKCINTIDDYYIGMAVDNPIDEWILEIERIDRRTWEIKLLETWKIKLYSGIIYTNNFKSYFKDWTEKYCNPASYSGDIIKDKFWNFCFFKISDLDNYDYRFFYTLVNTEETPNYSLIGRLFYFTERDWHFINPIRDDWDKIEILQSHVFNHSGKDILKTGHFSIPKP